MKRLAVLAAALLAMLPAGTALAQELTPTPPPIPTVTSDGLTSQNNPDIPFLSESVEMLHEALDDPTVAVETFYVAAWILVTFIAALLVVLKTKNVMMTAIVITAMFGFGYMLDVVDLWMAFVLGGSAFSLAAIYEAKFS
jgi:hypothetical protein